MFNSKVKPEMVIIILLSCVLAGQVFFIAWRVASVNKVPVFMPLLLPGEDYSSYDLERIGEQSARILSKVGRLGPSISLEDMVRGILMLEKEPGSGLALSGRQRRKISAVLKKAYKTREDLLKSQVEIIDLQRRLPVLGARIYAMLTPEQKKIITSGRDEISLKNFEESEWNRLLNSLETSVE